MIFGSSKFFVTIINDFGSLTVSAGYESGTYRTDEMTKLMIKALPEFALSLDELEQINFSNATEKLAGAACAFYNKTESQRGEPGE
ncbi:MAG: hypothetical protein B7Y39_16355 [Bdellovibrio sp. 28-41-41]|nr:MAG: hypothetical protein B7Y39_16355 [Bdellovibrio sp. 28-41-41]